MDIVEMLYYSIAAKDMQILETKTFIVKKQISGWEQLQKIKRC